MYGGSVLDTHFLSPYPPYMPYTERIDIRLTEEEKALIVKAAFKTEMKLSEFTRKMLVAAAEHYVKS